MNVSRIGDRDASAQVSARASKQDGHDGCDTPSYGDRKVLRVIVEEYAPGPGDHPLLPDTGTWEPAYIHVGPLRPRFSGRYRVSVELSDQR